MTVNGFAEQAHSFSRLKMSNHAAGHNRPSQIVGDRLLSGEALREWAKNNGYCQICGFYKTHERRGKYPFRAKFEPLTICNDRGELTVYKGFCLAPTCYTLATAQQELGELPPGNIPRSEGFGETPIGNRTRSGGGMGVGLHPPDNFHSNIPSVPTNNPTTTSNHPAAHSYNQIESSTRLPVPRFNGDAGLHPAGREHRTAGSRHISPHEPAPSAGVASYPTSRHRSSGDFNNHARNYSTGALPHFADNSPRMDNERGHSSLGTHNAPLIPSPYVDHRNLPTTTSAGVLSPHESPPTTISEQFEINSQHDDPLMRRLHEKIGDRNYMEVLNMLDDQKQESFVVVEGFRLLRRYIVAEHIERPEGTVLVGDNWVKIFNNNIARDEQDVILEGLLTLLAITRQGKSKYKASLVRKGKDEALVPLMKTIEEWSENEEILNAACAVVVSMAIPGERHSLNAKSFPKIATLIRKLSGVVLSDVINDKGMALRALFLISNQRKKSETTEKIALHDVRNAMGDEKCIKAIIEAILPDEVTPPVREAGLNLLWKLCLSTNENDDRGVFLGTALENAESILQIFENCTISECIEPACGLVANMATLSSFPSELAERVVIWLGGLLVDPSCRTIDVARVASHALCNLIAQKGSGNQWDFGTIRMGIETATMLLREFAMEEDVVEYSCLTFCHAAKENEDAKRLLGDDAVFQAVRNAFAAFVDTEDPSLPVKDSILCFFASISGTAIGAAAIQSSGMGDRLQRMLLVEADGDLMNLLEITSLNIENVGQDEEPGVLLLRQEPTLFPQLLHNASGEEDVFLLFKQLREAGESGLNALGGDGFNEIVMAMSKYEYSTLVIQEGCNLLAEVYEKYPLIDIETTTVVLPSGSAVCVHRIDVVNVLCRAMGRCNDPPVQLTSLMALTNLLIPHCNMYVDPSQIQHWLNPIWDSSIMTLESSRDRDVQMSVLRFFQILLTIASEQEIRNRILRLLQQIFGLLVQTPHNSLLNTAACDILLLLKDDRDCLDFMGNSPCVGSLVQLLQEENADLATRAAAMLSILATEVVIAMTQILEIPSVASKLVKSIQQHSSSAIISTHLCMILESIINFEDTSLRIEIVESGGLDIICYLVEEHQTNPALCLHACHVFAHLLPHIPSPAMAYVTEQARRLLLPLLHRHCEDCPECVAAVLDLLWTFSHVDSSFRRLLLTRGNLEMIVETMNLHLGSEQLQRSACNILWLVSGTPDEPQRGSICGKRTIGTVGGIEAVLNGMLVHRTSIPVLREGLHTIKNLAMEPCNKTFFEQFECVRVITILLRIHHENPSVIGWALSALNNVAVDKTTSSVAPLPSDIFEAVLSAMGRFPDDEVLQKSSCFYLRSCAYRLENLILMRQERQQLFVLLEDAASRYPQTCHSNAKSIMKKVK